MKEKILFIATIVGSFSATIILLITNGLVLLGVDTTGYANIINIVGMGLAVVILAVAMIYLNKYNKIQLKQALNQNNIVTTALDGNAQLMNSLLPQLANQILAATEERGAKLLSATELKVNAMMNEMLPALAEQTMQLVTEKSQNIVEQTTAKANATMAAMDELIPTYAKQISDSVAQTVRENNAHYHKMLVELKGITSNLPASDSVDFVQIIKQPLEECITAKLDNVMTILLDKLSTLATKEAEQTVEQIEAEQTEEQIEAEQTEAQSEQLEEESDESYTS